VTEYAELYALGVLEPQQRTNVDAHVAYCDPCAHALADAEAAVEALDDVFVPLVEPPARLGLRISASSDIGVPLVQRVSHLTLPPNRSARFVTVFLGAAAVLLLCVSIGGGVLFQRSTMLRQVSADSSVLATIATSHFNHASFTTREPEAPITKVLYARDGRWFYVIVDSASCDCRLVARSAFAQRDFGPLDIHGGTATRFVLDFPRPTSLQLVRSSGSVMSSVSLAY